MDSSSFFTPDVEFSLDGQNRRRRPSERSAGRWVGISAAAAVVAVSGVLAFYHPPTDLTAVDLNPTIIREVRPTPKHVPIRDVHLKAAEDYRARHVEMTPTDADRKIRPDYGI